MLVTDRVITVQVRGRLHDERHPHEHECYVGRDERGKGATLVSLWYSLKTEQKICTIRYSAH